MAVSERGSLDNLYTTGLTVTAWINLAGASSGGRIVDKDNNQAGWLLMIDPSTGELRFVADQFATTAATRNSASAIPTGTWTPVAVTWDGSSSGANIHVYINGQLADGGSVDGAGAVASDSGTPFTIGNRPLDNARGFDGTIDEVRVYNKVLAASEIAAIASDSQPPSDPSALTANASSASQIALSWTGSTDNVGVTAYLIERCQGSGCTNFTQIAAPSGTAYTDTGLTASMSYSYRVRAVDAAGNLSNYTNVASATTLSGAGGGAIAFVQGADQDPASASSVSVTYAAAQTAGDLNVVVLNWGTAAATITAITDTQGNTYTQAASTSAYGTTLVTYYAPNIAAAAAGANTVTVTFSTSVHAPDVAVLEYSGISASNPLDVQGGSSGTGTSTSSGPITTTSANDLIVAGVWYQDGFSAVGSGYTKRIVSDPDVNLVEDEVVTSAGNYTATSTQASASEWVMQAVAFRAAASGDTTPPTAPSNLSAQGASDSQINLTWSASTDNVAVTGYRIERCEGSGCTSFGQIGTSSGTSYSDTGLSASATYSYRVRATDAAGNLSDYSNTASATTSSSDSQPPSAPGTPQVVASSSSEVDLIWGASTDNVGVTGYLLERCSGVSCSNFVQIAAPTIAGDNDVGLSGATSYSYRVRAKDGAGNLSDYSATLTVTTPAASPDCN